MRTREQKVSIVTDLDELVHEYDAEPIWMVQPHMNRKYPTQRMVMTAAVVELSTINLAQLHMFEAC